MNESRRPLAVYFDDQVFSIHSGGGISRYFVELMRTFRDHSEFGVQLAGHHMWTRNDYVVESGFGRRLPLSPRLAVYPTRLLNRLTWRRSGAQIIHHTYYDRRYLKRFQDGFLRVVTIVDMIPELFPELFPAGNPHLEKQRYVDEADLVLCISESTRRDLLSLYGTPSSPIVVTPLGVDERFKPDLPPLDSLPDRYILFVGGRRAYKDFDVLAQAFALPRIRADVHLVAVGGGPLASDENGTLVALGVRDRVQHINLGDHQLAAAYANAECFAFPSRYEGFGLPTLEAMAAGCPAVLAASSAHFEVGGDAALFFEPGDVDGLAEALASVLEDGDFRQGIVSKGLEHADSFSWTRTAILTAKAYRQVIEGTQ